MYCEGTYFVYLKIRRLKEVVWTFLKVKELSYYQRKLDD